MSSARARWSIGPALLVAGCGGTVVVPETGWAPETPPAAGSADGSRAAVGAICPGATNLSGPCRLMSDDCGENAACRPVKGAKGWTTACIAAAGSGKLGAPCDTDAACAAGLFCAGVSGFCTAACCPAAPSCFFCDVLLELDGGYYVTACSGEGHE